ncbi:MAG: hypothetical protein V8R52_13995 [Coprobacter fastidiosus]
MAYCRSNDGEIDPKGTQKITFTINEGTNVSRAKGAFMLVVKIMLPNRYLSR